MHLRVLLVAAATLIAGVAAASERLDPLRPGAYLNNKLFTVPAGAAFVWEAWESPTNGIGEIRIDGDPNPRNISIAVHELARPSDDAQHRVLNQFTLRVGRRVPVGTVFRVQSLGRSASGSNPDWLLDFQMQVTQARWLDD